MLGLPTNRRLAAVKPKTQENMAITTAKQCTTHPFSYYWNLVKDMNDSQKLELIAVLAESIRPAKAYDKKADNDGEYSLRPFTMEELNARIEQAEADIAAGRVIDDDDAWDDLEEELAHQEKEEREMAEAI